jgi:hypothetical protein
MLNKLKTNIMPIATSTIWESSIIMSSEVCCSNLSSVAPPP